MDVEVYRSADHINVVVCLSKGEVILHDNRFKRGSEGLFFSDNAVPNNPSSFGFKFYPTKMEMEAAKKRQERAYSFGVAPPVGPTPAILAVTFTDWKDMTGMETWYGYQTAVAESHNDWSFPGRTAFLKTIDKLRLDRDIHDDNVMWFDGRYVLIDFGDASAFDDHEDAIRRLREKA